MPYLIVGLGNPGEKYKNTRHNTGRMTVLAWQKCLAKKGLVADWKTDKKLAAQKCEAKLGEEKVVLLLPEGFVNNSGQSIKPFIASVKAAGKLAVLHDDLDLPSGTFKLSFGRGSGGHKGVESLIRAAKTKNFLRIRIGVASQTPSGKLKKPQGEEKVIDFILGRFKPAELEIFKKLAKKIGEALECFVTEGRERAMNVYNRK